MSMFTIAVDDIEGEPLSIARTASEYPDTLRKKQSKRKNITNRIKTN